MSETPAPGKVFLIITGILDIIMGGLAALLALFGLFDRFFWADVDPIYPPILVLILGIWAFVIGIYAIAYCSILEKSKLLRNLGIIDLSLCVIGLFIKGFTYINLAGVAIPLLYFYGAFINVKYYANKGINDRKDLFEI